jgi:transcriptional regulator with XRE-family HTH domain
VSNEQPPLPQVIGAHLRALRTEIGWTQENIASVARILGFDWSRPTVTAIEAGDRALTLEEFFCLPMIYPTLGKLVNLFSNDRDHDRWVTLRVGERSTWVTPEWHLRRLLQGEAPAHEDADAEHLEAPAVEAAKQDEAFFGPVVGQMRAMGMRTGHPVKFPNLTSRLMRGRYFSVPETHLKVVGEWDPPAEKVYLELPWSLQQRRSEIEVAAKGDAERKAARKFSVSAELVSAVAFKRYHRSLTEERDMRLIEATPNGATSRTMQALRGHVTRTLLADMKNMIEHYKGFPWGGSTADDAVEDRR